jgi:eukaryotic-like serine/threonine-protein kinase
MRTIEPDSDTENSPDLTLESLWDRGAAPEVQTFIATLERPPLDIDALVAVLRVDQHRRWLAGERVDVSTYRRDFPILQSSTEAFFELLFHEFLIREQLGEQPESSEYEKRYPDLSERLRLQMEVHLVLSSDGRDEPRNREERNRAANDGESSSCVPNVPGYEILSEIGRGGMGIVYRARQQRPNRFVALKMILEGRFATEHELRRFENEAETIGAVEHPNIVPILEFGQHEGLHYFTMPLLTGGSLAEAQTRLGKDPRAIARLAAEVADAVHHAHQRGILHRDLKPANILLDDDGRPHVTDFGLAKRTEAGRGLTETGAVMGSPGYMSPEQASGAPAAITTASDVYGLGAILYSLLTGHAPFEGSSPRDVIIRVQDRPPDPPSRWNRAVPRPLELICLKCLEKDPARRYASAGALADDLRRWLAGEAIAARPVPSTVRVWLWIRRHPYEAALAAALVLAIVSGFGVVLQYADGLKRSNVEKEEARRQAAVRLMEVTAERKLLGETIRELRQTQQKEEKARREALNRYLLAVQVFENTFYGSGYFGPGEASILRIPNVDGLRSRTIRNTLELYHKLDAAIEADPTPEARARLALSYNKLGEMASEIDERDVALEAIHRSARIRRELAVQSPDDTRARLEAVDAVRKAGGMEARFGLADEALASFCSSYEMLVEEDRVRPGNDRVLSLMAQGLGNIAASLISRGQTEEGLNDFARVLKIRESLVAKDPRSSNVRLDHASSLWAFAHSLRALGRTADAIQFLETARAELELLFRERPSDRLSNLRFLEVTNLLAELYAARGRHDQAVRTTEAACDLSDALVRAHAEVATHRSWQADMRWHLYSRKRNAGVLDRPTLDAAVNLYEELVRTFPGVDKYRRNLARTLRERGYVARSAEDLGAAEDSLRRSLRHLEILAANQPSEAMIADVAQAKSSLAFVLIASGRPSAATPVIEAAERDLRSLTARAPEATYDLACALSVLAGATPAGPTRAAAADRAIVELGRAAEAGYRDVAHARIDPDLDAIRSHSKFPVLLRDLAVPVEPFAR